MSLPNFLILGTAKSGTSTLARYLCEHPQVCFSRAHEPNFFAFDRQWARGLAYYRMLFAHYDGEPRIGEKSWRYACTGHYPHVFDRVRRTLPELKLIYIVREPIARGLSMWRELRDAGQDRVARDVATALTSDQLILGSMRYHTQFSRYRSAYGAENMRLLFFEDFVRDQGATFDAVTDFLGIDRFQPKQTVHENRSVGQRSDTRVLEVIRHLAPQRPTRRWAPRPLRAVARRLLKKPIRTLSLPAAARTRYLDMVRDECAAILEEGGKPHDFWALH